MPPTFETLAIGLDGPFRGPLLQVIDSPEALQDAFAQAASCLPLPSAERPMILAALGPPANRGVQIAGVERAGDVLTVRYRMVPRSRLPQQVLLDLEDPWFDGSLAPEASSPYHLVQLERAPAGVRYRFEREQERSVMGFLQISRGEVVLHEEPLFSPMVDAGDRLRLRCGGFEAEVPLAWTGEHPGIPLLLTSEILPLRPSYRLQGGGELAPLHALQGQLVRIDGVVRRIGQPQLLPHRVWQIETGEQVFGPSLHAAAVA